MDEKIMRVSLTKEDQGYSISYEKRIPPKSYQGEFASSNTKYMKENFGEDQLDKAVSRFSSLCGIKIEQK